MKKIGLFLMFFSYTLTVSLAQQVSFALSFDPQTGTAQNAGKKWKIDPFKGSYLYLILQDDRLKDQPKAYFFIDKILPDGSVEEYDQKKIALVESKNWLAAKYTFDQEGTFDVIFLNAEKIELARDQVQIAFRSNITFAEQVDKDGFPINPRQVFSGQNNQDFFAFYKSSQPISNTQIVSCKIYKHDGMGYKTQVFEKEYKLAPSQQIAFFRLQMPTVGDYVFTIEDNETLEIRAKEFFKIK